MARFLFRRGRVINLLAAVAIAYLLADPDELFDASFQLSFLSVAAIGALAAPLLEATSGPYMSGLRAIDQLDADPHLPPRVAQARVEIRLLAETLELWIGLRARWAARAIAALWRLLLFGWELILVSAVIQVGLALPMAEDFHRISFTGLSANLMIVPLLSAVVPLGFAAIFTGWRWIARIAGWLLTLAAKIADWHAHIEPSWRIANPPYVACGRFRSVAHRASSFDPPQDRAMGGWDSRLRMFWASAMAALAGQRGAREAGADGDRRGPGR